MKTFFSTIILVLFLSMAHAQVRGSYAFAEGTTDAVYLRWDAFNPGSQVVEGCNVYKRTHFENPIVKLNDALIVSSDSNFVFVDTSGDFHPDGAPLYIFELIAGDLVDEVNSGSAFVQLGFELVQPDQVRFNARTWNPEQCCVDVSVWLNGSFQGFLDYSQDDGFVYVFDLEEFAEDDHILFVFNSFWGYYQEQSITGTYLHRFANPVSIHESSAQVAGLKVYPNPVLSEALITFELFEKEFVKLSVYSNDGRLVKVLQKGKLGAGKHAFHWHANGFAPGNYLILLTSDKQLYSTKLVVR